MDFTVGVNEGHVSTLHLGVYLNEEPITRRFFDAKPGSPVEAFAAEAHRHPVFRIMQPGSKTAAT